MLSYSLTATTAIGLLSSASPRSDCRGARRHHHRFRVSRVGARPGRFPGTPCSAIGYAASLDAPAFNGLKISDLGPFRAARADTLRALELEETTYGWAVELILKGAIQGFRIVEVPVSYHPRIGKSKISGTFRGTVGATWFILSRIARYYFRRGKNSMPRSA